ncbi:MAG TPA: GTP-binding protein [Burkholderiales bacterium]|nr:GTP-binding protein [Burkholderiales bacterium]
MTSGSSLTPVNVLTGFLGSGKTTLLQRLLRSPRMARSAVLINEFGEIGLDHLLVQHVDESVVLLQSGCICCSIRDDLTSALRGLLGRRERKEIPAFDRVLIETTGLADPGPILYTLLTEPVIRHHFQLGNVITTVDVVNAELHLSRNREGIKQVAAADRLVLTKSDLAEPGQTVVLRAELARLNPSARLWDAAQDPLDADFLLDVMPSGTLLEQVGYRMEGGLPQQQFTESKLVATRGLPRHTDSVSSFTLILDRPMDWTAFGVWLSLLLNRHGDNVLRVKGILCVEGTETPVFINGVQHIVHPPQHLEQWPTEDHRSRIVFITRGIDQGRLRRSLEAFCRLQATELSVA